jgi:hypothetical protein
VAAALDGAGLAFLPEDEVLAQIEAGQLVRVLDDGCPPFPGYHLYDPRRRPRRVRADRRRAALPGSALHRPMVGSSCLGRKRAAAFGRDFNGSKGESVLFF